MRLQSALLLALGTAVIAATCFALGLAIEREAREVELEREELEQVLERDDAYEPALVHHHQPASARPVHSEYPNKYPCRIFP